MAKRISWSVCLLVGVLVAGAPAQAAIVTAPTVSQPPLTAQPSITKTLNPIVAEPSTPVLAALTVEDLPPGFTELPPEIAASIASRLEVLQQQIGPGNLKPENFFAFVNPQNFQIVLGFTAKLPNQAEQSRFDGSLKQLTEPEVQQRTLNLLQEQLKAFGQVKVTEYRPIPELNTLANASTGITLGLEMRGQPLRLDLAAFRRNATGAFTGVIYANGAKPLVGVGDVAQKLDRRIEQLSSRAPRVPAQKLGSIQ
ncbi:MAG TPA: hypothetical protein V6D11_18680 [Waterburya sp.]|jgi:hypothetical protein